MCIVIMWPSEQVRCRWLTSRLGRVHLHHGEWSNISTEILLFNNSHITKLKWIVAKYKSRKRYSIHMDLSICRAFSSIVLAIIHFSLVLCCTWQKNRERFTAVIYLVWTNEVMYLNYDFPRGRMVRNFCLLRRYHLTFVCRMVAELNAFICNTVFCDLPLTDVLTNKCAYLSWSHKWS